MTIEVPEWDAPIQGTAPVHGAWETRSKWLDRISEPGASNSWVQLRFRSRSSTGAEIDNTMHGLRVSQFQERVPADPASGRISLAAELSTARILLQGERDGAKAAGEVEIVPDAAFMHKAGELLEGEPTLAQLIRFGLQPKPLEYIELVCTNGNRWTWSEVLLLQQRGVTPAFIHGVRRLRAATPESAESSANAPLPSRRPFNANEIAYLHSRGVTLDYIDELGGPGLAFSANELVHLYSRGVTTRYVNDVARSGLQADANQLVYLHSRGVPAHYISEILDAGYVYDANDLVYLHSRGVPARYALELKRAGYGYSASEIILVHSRGVPIEYLESIAGEDYQPLTASEVLQLHSRGVPTEMVRRLRK